MYVDIVSRCCSNINIDWLHIFGTKLAKLKRLWHIPYRKQRNKSPISKLLQLYQFPQLASVFYGQFQYKEKMWKKRTAPPEPHNFAGAGTTSQVVHLSNVIQTKLLFISAHSKNKGLHYSFKKWLHLFYCRVMKYKQKNLGSTNSLFAA
jgi:hypothetical protein